MSLINDIFGNSEASKEIAKDQAIQARWRRYIESCKDERPLWEGQVAVCMNFADGNHRVSVTKEGMFKEHALLPGQIWRTVNLWPITLSVITTRLTANDPRWNPRKSQLSNVSDAEIEAADAALQHIWSGSGDSERSVKREMKRAIRSGYKQGRRLLYMRFDDELNLPVLDSYSLWDVYSDPSAEAIRDKRWLCISLPKHIDWLEETYPAAKALKLSPDQKLAESRLQEQFLKGKTGQSRDTRRTINTIYGFRIVSRDYEEETVEEIQNGVDDAGDPIMEENTVMVTKSKNIILHEVVVEAPDGGASPVIYREEIDYPYLSDIFDSFSPKDDEDFHARPPCIDWVDPSKSIDSVFSTIEAYVGMFGQGRWIVTKKGITIPVGGIGAQVIEAQPGDLVQLPMHPLPSTHFTHLQNAKAEYQEITGVHSATLGNMPSGDTSGKALAQSSALDEQNSSDDVDNFRLCLERVAIKMLRIMSDNWDEVQTLYRYDENTGESKEIKVIGERFKDNLDLTDDVDRDIDDDEDTITNDNGVVIIRPFMRVDVEIVVGPFFKSIHKQELLVQILNTGWQPGMNPVMDSVILDTIDIGAGREMVRKLKTLRNPQQIIAEGKAMLIVEGEAVSVTRTDPHKFLKDFYAKKAKEKMENGDQRASELLNAQAQKHAMLMQKGMGDGGNPEAPGNLEEFMRGQGESEAQGNEAPEVPAGLDQAASALGGAAQPIPGMNQ